MDNKEIGSQIWQLAAKYGAWISWIFLGIVGRFSYDLIRNKKFTISYILGATGIGILGGYVFGVWILQSNPAKAPILIPMITMLSNNFVSVLMTIDYKALLRKDWRGAFELLFPPKNTE